MPRLRAAIPALLLSGLLLFAWAGPWLRSTDPDALDLGDRKSVV